MTTTLDRRSRAAVARSSGGDRWLVSLIGLVLLAGGVLVALLGFGVFGAGRAERPILDPLVTDWLAANPGWARTIAIAAGVLIAILGLVWVARSIRPEARPDLRVESGPETQIVVASSAFADAVAGQAARLPGVSKARARMVGSDRAPALRITLWLSDDADVRAVLDGLGTDVLGSARTALGVDELPVAVRLELDSAAPQPRVH